MMTDQPTGQLTLNGVDPLQTAEFFITKRNGRKDLFNEARIHLAIEAAFRAEHQIPLETDIPEQMAEQVRKVSEAAISIVLGRLVRGDAIQVEAIQDQVEAQLMASGFHSIARRYIIYREERKKARAEGVELPKASLAPQAETQALPTPQYITHRDGTKERFQIERIEQAIQRACEGLDEVDFRKIAAESVKNLYEEVSTDKIDQSNILAARTLVEKEPAYSYAAARLLLQVLYREVLPSMDAHQSHFKDYIHQAIELGRLSPELATFDLERLSAALKQERDLQFQYTGLQTIYDRYLIHEKGRRLETPQFFWMRVSMGLAILEGEAKNDRAIEFYDVLSSFHFVSSTPTLFNAGTNHPQLSSCYLSTVMDDLDHIFKVVADDAKLSKWAGGLGNDWTNVRATGSHIKGTNGESQGVIPFLKVANDTAVAVNQGGKRKGAMCAYLETWHLDVEDFLELRKNTGDERRRTHDMNTANWIPDLFMKRVAQNASWTLFDPSEVPDLHQIYGTKFEKRYLEYEARAARGEMRLSKKVDATTLWRKMLSMVFETGHPWITFKDPSNIRSPQDHAGVVHSSNLCTEILLNTSEDETAVCNLGSVNLARHMKDGQLDIELIGRTVKTAMRMLDNVVDINFYPTIEAKQSNMKHRPVGLGLMGFQDALYQMRVSYASKEAIEFADASMEAISYHAILASTELAKERGTYESYKGSKWDRGLLPIDTVDLLEKERGGYLNVDRTVRLDWEVVREAIRKHGMRNSNTMAIAPTATISNITGAVQSIEPTYANLFVKSNLSGQFTQINTYLVQDLKRIGLWDDEMIDDLKHFDGSLVELPRIPAELKELYLTAFEVEAKWVIECASRRQKWIDMGQSLNLYLKDPSGRKLSEMYQFAWEKGLKTTYYLRTLAATQIEKSTTDVNRRSIQPRWMKNKSASSNVTISRETTQPGSAAPKACSIDNPDCESCQ